jgi:hypothetical protein
MLDERIVRLSETEGEQLGLLASRRLQGTHLLPSCLMKSMSAFFSQAKRQLGEQPAARQEREWLKKVRVVSTSQPLLPPKVDNQVFEQVCSALYGDQWLTVEYHNAAGEDIKSRIMLLRLVQQGPRMYLVCRFDGYPSQRPVATLTHQPWRKHAVQSCSTTLTSELMMCIPPQL